MLSDNAKKVYEILRFLTKEDEVFKIIDADEVMDRLPQDLPLTKVQLSSIIKELKENNYIVVKYFTPDEYCLETFFKEEIIPKVEEAPVQVKKKKGDIEQVKNAEAPVNVQNSDNKPMVSVKTAKLFWMAFLGAFLGGAIVSAITAIIVKVI